MINNIRLRIEFRDREKREGKELAKVINGTLKEAVYGTKIIRFIRINPNENFYSVTYIPKNIPILSNEEIGRLEKINDISVDSIESYVLLQEYNSLSDESKLRRMKKLNYGECKNA